ncbi:MAG: hypothetical protein WDO74_30720 [Pseudomonadota bacterium]
MKIKRSFHWLTHLARVAAEEAGPLLSRRLLTQRAAVLLPQQSFNRTRTALLRAAGVQIGEYSLIQGPVYITGSTANPCPYLSIGEYTLITGPLHIDLAAPVRIGKRRSHRASRHLADRHACDRPQEPAVGAERGLGASKSATGPGSPPG